MQLNGLITITPDQVDLIDRVADFMGASFLEELWTATYLEALDPLAGKPEAAEARKREIACAMMRTEFARGAAHACAYALPDCAGAFLGYLGSELAAQNTAWTAIEAAAHEDMARAGMASAAEAAALEARGAAMERISYFGWGSEEAADMGCSDHIYFAAWAVNPENRGSGAFRRLIEPAFDFADSRGIPCFLECYSDRLISLYEHVGFEVFRTFEDPAFDIVQTCMVRRPQ